MSPLNLTELTARDWLLVASKRKAGRPRKYAKPEPWKAEGISRATWYRKHKGTSDV